MKCMCCKVKEALDEIYFIIDIPGDLYHIHYCDECWDKKCEITINFNHR